MGALQHFCKNNCFSILLQAFFVLAFIGGYIAFLVTFYNTNRDKAAFSRRPCPALLAPPHLRVRCRPWSKSTHRHMTLPQT